MYLCIDRDHIIGDVDICNFTRQIWDPDTDSFVVILVIGTRLYDRETRKLYSVARDLRLYLKDYRKIIYDNDSIKKRNKESLLNSENIDGIFSIVGCISIHLGLVINVDVSITETMLSIGKESIKDITKCNGNVNIARSSILRSCITHNHRYQSLFLKFPNIDTLLKLYKKDSDTIYSYIDRFIDL